MPDRKTTTERGLGYEHRRTRRRLLANHIDGLACPCLITNDCGPACLCRKAGRGLPMYRTASLNPDGLPLQADHTLSRAHGGKKADRLLLATCNASRGAGREPGGAAEQYAAPWWTRNWLGDAGLDAPDQA